MVTKFKNYLSKTNLAKNTINSYVWTVEYFLNHYGEVNKKNLLAYIIHSGFISGYQNRYGDNLKPPTNVYHRMTA